MSAPATLPPGDGCLGVLGGHLAVEEVPVAELARRFGTPLHVVSERQLRLNARAWRGAAEAAWPEGPVLVMPSLKANTSLALRTVLNEEGLGCDVFGPGELAFALRAGVPGAHLSLNGATKSDALLTRAVAAGVRVTVDSLDELERLAAAARAAGATATVRLRLRPWLPGTTAASDVAPGAEPAYLAVQDYRAGMPDDEVPAALALAHGAPELDLSGLMAHVSRQTTDLAFWRAHAHALGVRAVAASAQLGGWRPRELDLGGGFAVPRDPAGRGLAARDEALAPEPAAYAAALCDGLRAGLAESGLDPAGVQLELEPGRAIYGNAGLHLTRVLHVKRQTRPVHRAWIEVDTSEAFLADLAWEHAAFGVVLADDPGRPHDEQAAVTGISCGFDVLAPVAARPRVTPGEVLALLDTGAYQDATGSNFNAMPRPATVLVSGGDARVVKRAETLDDLFAREVPA